MLRKIGECIIGWIKLPIKRFKKKRPKDKERSQKRAVIYQIDENKGVIRSSFVDQFKPRENEKDPKLCQEKAIEKALEKAWRNRDFEIEMYWKRATYFWTFIGVTLAGYFALIGSKNYNDNLKADFYHIEIFIITLGLMFSLAWYFVNKGSKRWQVNWEAQIDQLEHLLGRPNYTVIFHKKGYHSVSRINQQVSLMVVWVWVVLYVSHAIRFFDCYVNLRELSAQVIVLNACSYLTLLLIARFVCFLQKGSVSGISSLAETIMDSEVFKSDRGEVDKSEVEFFFKRGNRGSN